MKAWVAFESSVFRALRSRTYEIANNQCIFNKLIIGYGKLNLKFPSLAC
jgi:hypothetical protein